MKLFFMSVSFLCLATMSSGAFAGTEGHGGGGVFCTDPVTQATTVELLDFYRGTKVHGLTIPRSDTISVADQLDGAYAKMKSVKFDPEQVRDSVKDTLKHAHFVDVDDFPVPKDTGKIDLPAGCRLVGIVNYKDHFFGGPTVLVNARMFDRLSNTDKAGLWFHEAGYWIFREYLSDLGKDSTEAQRFTAITFSTEANYTTTLWLPKKY